MLGRLHSMSERITRSWRTPAFALLVVITTLIVKAEVLNAPVESDSGLYAYTAAQILDGLPLFGETPFAFKPPGVYLIDALAMTVLGKTSLAIHVLDTLWTALTAVALAYLLRGMVRGTALVATTVLFVVLYSTPALAGTGNTADAYVGLPTILGVRYLLVAQGPNRRGSATLLAGLMFGVSVLFKQSAAVVPMALVPLLLFFWYRDQVSRSDIARRCALLFAGVAVPVLALVAYTVLQGTFAEMVYEVLIFPYQAATAGRNPVAHPELFARTVVVLGYFLLPISFLGLLSGVLFMRGRIEFARAHAVFIGWFGGALLGATTGAIGSGHYYLPVIAPLCALSAVGLGWLVRARVPGERGFGAREWLAIQLCVVVLMLPALWRDMAEFRRQFLYVYVDHPRPPTTMERLALFVRDRTDPTDYIYGYGSHKYAAVAFFADRRLATRHVSPKMFDGQGYSRGHFLHPSKVKWMPEEIRRNLVERRPRLIFGFQDSDLSGPLYGDLGHWIRENYVDYDRSALPSWLLAPENADVLPIRVWAPEANRSSRAS